MEALLFIRLEISEIFLMGFMLKFLKEISIYFFPGTSIGFFQATILGDFSIFFLSQLFLGIPFEMSSEVLPEIP